MSAASLNTLDTLVSQVPEQIRPVMQHVATMLRSSMIAFDSHVAENVQSFQAVETANTRLAERTSALEVRADSVTSDGDRLTTRINALEGATTELTSRADTVAADGAKAVAELANFEAKFGILHAAINELGGHARAFGDQVGVLKSSVDHLELLASADKGVSDRVKELERVVNTRSSGTGVVGGASGLKSSYDYREIARFGNMKDEDFRQWRESVKNLCESRPEALEALEWAAAKREPITEDELRVKGYYDFSRELWGVLGSKTKEAPWRLQLAILGRNGLEHWRQLASQYNPQSPEDAGVLQHQLLSLPPCPPEALSDALTRVDGSIVEHDKMATSPMSEDIRKAIYEKICPSGWLTQMRLAGVDISTASKLKAQMLLHVRGGKHDAKLRSLATHGTPMDLGYVAAQSPEADETTRLLKELGDMKSSLAALMHGKGGAGGGGAAKGTWSGYSPSYKGSPSWGKGGGKGGKGPTAAQVALKRAGGDYSKVLCPTELRTGKCDYTERSGKPCRYMHARNVPKSLASIEGLIASDLQGVNLTYDAKEGTFVCSEKPASEQASMSFANVVSQECQSAAKELLEEFVILGSSVPEGGAGETPGFPRHSP